MTNKAKPTYAEQLQSPKWQKKRLEIFNRDKWTCRLCGDKAKTLHVHHLLYCHGLRPWEYDNDFLITLCHDCHIIVMPQVDISLAVFALEIMAAFGVDSNAYLLNLSNSFKALDRSEMMAMLNTMESIHGRVVVEALQEYRKEKRH